MTPPNLDIYQNPKIIKDLPPKPYHRQPKKLPLIFIFLITFFGAISILFMFSKNINNPEPLKQSINKITHITKSKDDSQQSISVNSKIVDTNQTYCFNNSRAITCSTSHNGQDAQYLGNTPKYQINGDGTITDLNTGLMWIKDPGEKTTYQKASQKQLTYAGYSDWRVPTIKELYTLMDFNGIDPNSELTSDTDLTPFIDNSIFDFEYGNTSNGDRIIDSQWITSNIYTSTVMNDQECFFGVNFADGRIKCYPVDNNRNNGYFIRYVRGDIYGVNSYTDNTDLTISDNSSGLMWQKKDSGKGMNWEDALEYCENLNLAQHTDWRLPNAKELQYIVDYQRSPDTTNSPAINPIFVTSTIRNEMGQKDYPYFWTSTTHINQSGGENAAYISFGRAIGKMNNEWMDVHGAGAQRSDPKSGSIENYPISFGPQGDARRLHNYVRCVRGGDTKSSDGSDPSTLVYTSMQNSQGAPSNPTIVNSKTPTSQTPPQPAIDACSQKSINQPCNFTTPNGSISGICRQTNNILSCIPN